MALQTLVPAFEETSHEHRVVDLRRVARVRKGGRRFRFRATVVVGDKRGNVGMGIAKGRDAQGAIAKAQEAAKKRLVRVSIEGGTIPYACQVRFRGAEVLVKPAPEGTGIRAGGAVRAVATLAGIRDLSSKVMGSRNTVNVVTATLKALSGMKTAPASGGPHAT